MNLLLAPPGSPWWLIGAAYLVLFLHIAGGSVAIVAGFVALLARKGGTSHRIAGTAFFVSMLVMASIGAVVSPFLPKPELANVSAAILTIYLVLTSWSAIRRRDGRVGMPEKIGLAIALGVVASGLLFMQMAKSNPGGTTANTPPQAFWVFVIAGTLCAIGDVSVIVRGSLSGTARIVRHLWRMCAALAIASGSFFLGQQKVMPEFMRGSPWLMVPAFAPLLLMLFWLIRVRVGSWRRRAPVAT